jgi:hypothetical protein
MDWILLAMMEEGGHDIGEVCWHVKASAPAVLERMTTFKMAEARYSPWRYIP